MKFQEAPAKSWPFTFLVWPWIKLISLLPFWALYLLSDGVYFLLFWVIKYRRVVVKQNLERCFPNKTEKEIAQIEKSFYHHLSDLMVETIKGISISENEMKRRMVNVNQEIYDDLKEKGQSSIIVMSHCGNWEWICLMSQLSCKQQIQCVYKTLSSQGFDRLMFLMRSKFGANPIPMEQTLRVLATNKDIVTCNAFIGDQNPSSGKTACWVDFFNQETAFMWGPEKIARKFNWPLYYLSTIKIKRGYYQALTVPLALEPNALDEGEITQLIARHTQKEIENQPETWLWSHRRWKHTRAVN